MASRPPLLIADHRPGEPMATLPLKLSADAVPRLQAQADWLRCNRIALGCALLLQALGQLEATEKPSGDRRLLHREAGQLASNQELPF